MSEKVCITFKTVLKIFIAAMIIGSVVAGIVILINKNKKVNEFFSNMYGKCRKMKDNVEKKYFSSCCFKR